ncbi:MAG: hypothetical protein CVU87_02615 [Firmicutes bacterium HGW-Firmicutes-12]|jgi:hypothetical protein|nr:MAG: hypothetical protein CVU87_02615 [Firmicutes bacterium HGW-Firmicutes-12]
MLCPLCNGLDRVFPLCPNCEEILEDAGMLENFFAPYNPYLAQEILEASNNANHDECIHLFSCPKCGYDQRLAIKKIDT